MPSLSSRPITAAFLLAFLLVGAPPLQAHQEPAASRAFVDDLRIERFGDAPPRAVRFELDHYIVQAVRIHTH